jgi:hypothetical protein
MATYGNPGEGVDQSLRAIIKAGDEFFGIVDVLTISQTTGKTPKFMEDTVITRHLPNQRAELIGFVNRDGKPITIGRSYQDLGIKTSREHFLVIQDMDGAIGIVEPHKTTNGTEVFTPSKNSKFGVSEKLLHMDTVDAVEDFDFWSVKSDDVKARLGSATRLQ